MDSRQAETDLSVIKTIMEDSRKIAIANGIYYILWGILVSVALVVTYLLILNHLTGQNIGITWLAAILAGWIATIIISKRINSTRRVRTFAGKILGALWIGSGIAMTIFGFVGTMSHAYDGIFICPINATVLGAAYFASGIIQSQSWIRNLSFGWWAGAVLLFIFPSIHTLLIFAFMMTVFQTIPGVILYRQRKKYESAPVEYA
jgi:hypothetical protein